MNREKLLKEKERVLKNIENRKRRVAVIDELVKELENKKWKPEIGEGYYAITGSDGVYKTHNENCPADSGMRSIGNYFKTKEEAEFVIERLKVLEELKEFSYEFSDKEWMNTSISKYYILYYFINDQILIEYTCTFKKSPICFKTREDAIKAIEKVGKERLKKYYFKVSVNNA